MAKNKGRSILAHTIKVGDALQLNGSKPLRVLRSVISPKGKIKLTVQAYGRERVLEYLPSERISVTG